MYITIYCKSQYTALLHIAVQHTPRFKICNFVVHVIRMIQCCTVRDLRGTIRSICHTVQRTIDAFVFVNNL